MLRTMTVAALSLVLFAHAARADEAPVVAAPPPASLRTSIASVRFDAPDHALPIVWQRSSRRNSTAQKAAAGFALGFLGLLAGGWLGAQIEGNSCSCDDPGLKGAMIGAPIGAIAGAIAGVRLASR